MKIHLQYLRYILRHKWYVFLECCKAGIPWRGVTHDLSKFRPSEWIPYARWFYGTHGVKFNGGAFWEFDEHKECSNAFDRAWLLHQHRNPHHWQYWILRLDDGGLFYIEMPEAIRREMVADWRGAGRAITGSDNTTDWFAENQHHIDLAPKTLEKVMRDVNLRFVRPVSMPTDAELWETLWLPRPGRPNEFTHAPDKRALAVRLVEARGWKRRQCFCPLGPRRPDSASSTNREVWFSPDERETYVPFWCDRYPVPDAEFIAKYSRPWDADGIPWQRDIQERGDPFSRPSPIS